MDVHVDCLITLAMQESGFVVTLVPDITIPSDDGSEQDKDVETYF
jgi:hypothetical protein